MQDNKLLKMKERKVSGMYRKKECVAMLLAGGQGSRLYTLTSRLAKPAVSFGGKYRIIDFTLSNCVNSGIDTVGVLTQYQPLLLNDYIGNGLPWDLDRTFGGVKILPPYQGKKSADWYRGTANAIYQNIEFIDRYDPEYVLVLSGDHIYKMDYSKMLDAHKKNGADCTIAVIEVPLSEASRFGIMTTDADDRITKFSEKPKNPDSTKASMGIYIFNKEKLFKYLREDEANVNRATTSAKTSFPQCLPRVKKCTHTPSAATGRTSVPYVRFGKPTWICSAILPRSSSATTNGAFIRVTMRAPRIMSRREPWWRTPLSPRAARYAARCAARCSAPALR